MYVFQLYYVAGPLVHLASSNSKRVRRVRRVPRVPGLGLVPVIAIAICHWATRATFDASMTDRLFLIWDRNIPKYSKHLKII